ncbi:hypothetical protein VUR80DRAFT_2365 [Thermomyces stellatus]
MKIVMFLLVALSLLPLSLSTPLTDTVRPSSPSSSGSRTDTPQAPTPVQTSVPTQPPRTAFPGLDFTKPAELARTTPAPGDEPARPQGGGQREIPFSQETYYTCITRGETYTHCGWHMPVVWVGEAGVGRVHVGGKGLMVGLLTLAVGVVMG